MCTLTGGTVPRVTKDPDGGRRNLRGDGGRGVPTGDGDPEA